MAALTGLEIIVPPDPGLMGAFGVAIETDNQLQAGMTAKTLYNLSKLAARKVKNLTSFACRGGRDGCDLQCEIMRIEIDSKVLSFGGVCSLYDRQGSDKLSQSEVHDYVIYRQKRAFADLVETCGDENRPTVGMNRSFLINSFLPFYHSFFTELGFRLILPGAIDEQGLLQIGASYCFPVELAHGYMADLLRMEPDYLFLPHVLGIPGDQEEVSCNCVFVQSEPSILHSAFPSLEKQKVLSPVLDFSHGLHAARPVLLDIAEQLGCHRKQAEKAFAAAVNNQEAFTTDLKEKGKAILRKLEKDSDQIGIVVFGRPYNSFAMDANKGIPRKVASKNVSVIPFDMLSFEDIALDEELNMFWGIGRRLLQAAHYVASHPQLYGLFISNFSCGPDSFILTHFRDIMGNKPSLILELDSHSANAGLETRIEAFLDIIKTDFGNKKRPQVSQHEPFNVASFEFIGGRGGIKTSSGDWVPLTDPRVRMVVPPMGKYGTALFAKTFEQDGIRSCVLPAADREMLKIGRGNTSCKECLPLQTTIGSLLHYIREERPEGELTVYYLPSAPGPCRFGQYGVFTQKLLREQKIRDLAVFSPTSKNFYGGLSLSLSMALYRGIVIGDLFDEMYATILAAARNKDAALACFSAVYDDVLGEIDKSWRQVLRVLRRSAIKLKTIELVIPFEDIPKIALVGEIYVRHDSLALQQLVEKMAEKGFAVRTAQNTEWLKYIEWLVRNKVLGKKTLFLEAQYWIKEHIDARVRRALSESGLLHSTPMDIDMIIKEGERYIPLMVKGEMILTIGAAFHEILNPACGVISIGPFGCMPARVSESILNAKFTGAGKRKIPGNEEALREIITKDRKFPFLAIETDGKPFPQIIDVRLEAFCLQARRLHEQMMDVRQSEHHR